MATLNSINFKNNEILVNLKVSSDEYNSFRNDQDLLVLSLSSLDISLVTGTLGNSNRIMLPNKVLRRNEVKELLKNAPSRIIKAKTGKYLIIKLEGSEDIPKFKITDPIQMQAV